MHASLKKSTHDMHQAFKPWGFSEEQVRLLSLSASPFNPLTERVRKIRYGFGTLGALSTYFLLRRSTRGLGLVLSIAVTLVGRVYPQMTIKSLSGQDLAGPMAVMILAAFSLGLLS